ncbi:MAG: tetratricopeptide repeat protein [Verrucomicrobia bacterium]|nr:tetratricopeptide repeat protein [Verrucomicrobiota bacterium]
MLIQQLADMDRLDAALATAEAATSQFPFVPRLWLDRAWVHELRRELEPAIAALERALVVNPSFGEASRQLASAYHKRGDLEKACQVLELACVHSPLEAANHGCLADILWHLGRKPEALERLQHALRLDPGCSWAWPTLARWASELNDPDLAIRLARDLADRRPGEARSWILLAECLGERRDPEALAAVDRALKCNPHAPEVYDLKARLLALEDRFDEALACCHPSAFPNPPPALLVREAWLEAQRGRLNWAIARLESVLTQHPAHYGGWQLLAEWQQQAGDLAKATRAADEMARLAPQDPMPLGYAASLSIKQGDRTGAMARLQRAIALNPSYEYAGLALFDLTMEDGDLEAAGEILEKLKRHAESEWVSGRAIEWEARRGKKREALALFANLCRQQTEQGSCLGEAAKRLDSAGWRRAADKLASQILRESAPNRHLGAFWVARRSERRRFRLTRFFQDLFNREGELGSLALAQYLDVLGENHERYENQGDSFAPWRLRRYICKVFRKHRERLWREDSLWGRTGCMLVTANRFQEAAEWLADWQNRKGVEAWMLHNLALAQAVTNQPEQALTVIRHALKLRQDPNLFARFSVFGAVEEAVAGHVTEAAKLIGSVPADQLDATGKILRGLAQAVLTAEDQTQTDSPSLAKRLRADLRNCFQPFQPFRYHALIRKCYWRCMRRLSARPGLEWFRWWGWWHYRRWGWVALALAVPMAPILAVLPPVGWILLVVIWRRYLSR